MKTPWKKNLNKIPDSIMHRVLQYGNQNIVAACSQKIKPELIIDGIYEHLDIKLNNGQIEYPKRVLPQPEIGRYSYSNVNGREIVYRDEPKISKTYSVETPNYGDWQKGSHEVYWDRKVYRRAFRGPKYSELIIEFLGVDDKNNFIFKFTIDEVLNIGQPNFWDDLLIDLNLLQENVGNHGIFTTTANLNDYLQSLYVSWEILPPGEIEDNITRILSGVKSTDTRLRQRITDRYKFLLFLKPQNIIQGTSGFQRYFGAKFADDLVVFENVEYGNAIYVMFGNWEQLSQKSRSELLSSEHQDFIRIRHTRTWKYVLRARILKELRARKAKQSPF